MVFSKEAGWASNGYAAAILGAVPDMTRYRKHEQINAY